MKIFTTREVASLLRVDDRKVRALALAGVLKSIRPQGSRKFMFTDKQLAKFLNCDAEDL